MKLKLIRGLSYTNKNLNIKVTNLSPFIEITDEETAKTLISSGHFEGIKTAVEKTDEKPKINTPPVNKPLDITKMTEKQLEDYAKENGIDLTGIVKKADKLAKIQQALAELEKSEDKSGDVQTETDGEDKIDFGENE